VATTAVGVGIGSQIVRYGGSAREAAIWDYTTVGPMFMMQ